MIRHFGTAVRNLTSLEELSAENSPLHVLSAEIKIVFTFAYIITVVSFPVYAWSGLLIFFLYPAIALPLGGIPGQLYLRRVSGALLLVCFAGISNLLFDRREIPVGPWLLPGGAVSFAVLLMKAFLTVGAAVILAATTPICRIAAALRRFHLPPLFILQFLLIWRYLAVLLEEAERVVDSYRLRAAEHRAIPLRDWPGVAGSLLFRSIHRAERIYQAMQCRLFEPQHMMPSRKRIPVREVLAGSAAIALCLLCRFFDIAQLAGGLFQ